MHTCAARSALGLRYNSTSSNLRDQCYKPNLKSIKEFTRSFNNNCLSKNEKDSDSPLSNMMLQIVQVKPSYFKIRGHSPFLDCRRPFHCSNVKENFSDHSPNQNDKSKVLINFLRETKLTPVYCYEDLNLNSTRKKIETETKNLSGIYLILNKVTLDYYIGSAATNRFYARFSNHLIYFRGSKIVKLAVRKYKLDQFAFLILEIFPDVVNRINNKRLLDLEDFYLKSLLPNYNILTEAGSSFGYKHTEVTRLKMKAEYSQERREKIGSLNRGNSLPCTTKEKLRKKALTRDKRIYSEAQSAEAILNMKKKSKPIILYNLDNTVYGEFSSIVEAAKSIGCSEKTIRRAFKTNKKILKRRWIVKYL
jgi:group I intron endonuclease